ncbi:hypothetical protein RN001_008399 [Aquatica leii]|uniref:Tyr recombinase domain-containing protein n=1 Tax=Aquatica leii TaxID=1421715 RepID=A0AAN7PAP7_9COLE|nr:hypothetical protein RN001_008399 [Aquatica leii]
MVYDTFKEFIKNYTENCLLAYFQEMPCKKSLWPIFSMLKSCLSVYDNIDISKYSKVIALIKRESSKHKPKKSKVLTDNEINKFISEAPDSFFLLIKAALIMGISGACRREELCKMSIDDIEFKTDVVMVTVPATKTNVCRKFVITKPEWITLLVKYNDLRRSKIQKRYFLTFHNGKCNNSPVGLNQGY